MDHLPLMGRFNAWVNERLYGAVAGLPDAAYRQDRKAFFGSIHNTHVTSLVRAAKSTSF